jgi:hypothetical protein
MTSLTYHIGRYILRLSLLALLALAALAPAPAAQAIPVGKNFYVDPIEGSDANTGELAQPFRTLFKALTTAHIGDIVRLGPGIYSQATNGEQFGTNTQPIPVVSGVAILGTIENGLPASILLIRRLGVPFRVTPSQGAMEVVLSCERAGGDEEGRRG